MKTHRQRLRWMVGAGIWGFLAGAVCQPISVPFVAYLPFILIVTALCGMVGYFGVDMPLLPRWWRGGRF